MDDVATVAGHDHGPLHPQVSLRSPDTVMRLDRMGAFFPTRLSFMRVLLRRLSHEESVVRRVVWEMDDNGYGHAVYSVDLGGHTYSLVAFALPLSEDQRTDRVIAEAWDSSFVLFDGVPDATDIVRLQANAPMQEAGRFDGRDLILSRANKSVRLFNHVVEALATGRQPDSEMLGTIGYLMRTTAVYGNGKFGIADRQAISGRPGLTEPFQAEMLIVWLIRGFTIDLVEHIARARCPVMFVPMERILKRHIGVGNATGLGMAPFLVSHPILLNNWMMVRETALARVRAIDEIGQPKIDAAIRLISRVTRHLRQWNVEDERQMQRISLLRDEWQEFSSALTHEQFSKSDAWEEIFQASQVYSLECQELVVALMLEVNGDLVDGLTDCLSSEIVPRLEPAMQLAELKRVLAQAFDWALRFDFEQESELHQFWYVSEEKLEPRLGERFEEPGSERESPLDIARQAQALNDDLDGADDCECVASFVMRHPQHRHIVRRVQVADRYPYSEIRENLLANSCLPIDMLRCKLSFFGASKFDPKSDLWTRITMYQGAPLLDELDKPIVDDWWLPTLEID
ncbi:MAG: hypothetical protein CBC34_011035 [Hyphomicrobiaceae bacterium TMED74]|nr:hypothetical protein [Filomicrobium sp.]RPG40992.1 MAG: hypothetical protein CBC34_011035 [Hyphomicrobiaceae bacterium TMED74]